MVRRRWRQRFCDESTRSLVSPTIYAGKGLFCTHAFNGRNVNWIENSRPTPPGFQVLCTNKRSSSRTLTLFSYASKWTSQWKELLIFIIDKILRSPHLLSWTICTYSLPHSDVLGVSYHIDTHRDRPLPFVRSKSSPRFEHHVLFALIDGPKTPSGSYSIQNLKPQVYISSLPLLWKWIPDFWHSQIDRNSVRFILKNFSPIHCPLIIQY